MRVPVLSAYHLRPGLTQFWLRQALRLRIDPNQLSSGGQPPGYPSLLPRNFTSEVRLMICDKFTPKRTPISVNITIFSIKAERRIKVVSIYDIAQLVKGVSFFNY